MAITTFKVVQGHRFRYQSKAENRAIVSSFVWTQYRNVTDRRTDRHNPSS